MADLMKEGKITHWGMSEATEENIRKANSVCPLTAIQNRYSMMARHYESLFPVLEELNIGFVAFSPLANGFLSGKYNENSKFEKGTDYRTVMPQFTADGVCQNKELLELLNTLAKDKNATPAQISLAWMMCKKPYIVPIPGTRKHPIWWGIAAWPVNNFVKSNDFSGKTVIPFCTSSSSGLGQSGDLLADMAGTGNWQDGERFSSGASSSKVESWVNGLDLK